MGRRRNGAGAGAFLGSLLGTIVGGAVGSVPLAAAGSVAGGAIGGGVGARPDRRKRGAAGGALGGLLAPPGAALGGYLAGKKPDRDFRKRNPDVLDRLAQRDPPLAQELVAAADAFFEAVPQALEVCFEKYPPQSSGKILVDPYVVFSTLSGGDVGVWDGCWDPFYKKRGRRHWNRVQSCLRHELRVPHRRLEDALVAAAYKLHDSPAQRRARRLARKLTR